MEQFYSDWTQVAMLQFCEKNVNLLGVSIYDERLLSLSKLCGSILAAFRHQTIKIMFIVL